MKTLFNLLVFSFVCLFVTGCGHNTAVQSKGWGLDFSWNQDGYIPNLRLGYWDASSVVVKENVEAELVSGANIAATTGDKGIVANNTKEGANAGGEVSNSMRIKTGQQINGYTRDVLVSPDLKQANVDMANAIYSNKSVKAGEAIPVEITVKTDEKKAESSTNRELNGTEKVKPIKITIIIEK